MTRRGTNISLKSYEDIFTTEEKRQETGEQVVMIPVNQIHEFKNHPFKVLDDEDMRKTVDSIREYGVLVPVIIRPDGNGEYEMISGHRRRYASILAGKKEVPAIIREMDDDTATILMVDSNLQREHILPSERAKAYKMKMEALSQHLFLPIVSMGGEDDKWIGWGATIPDSEGNYYYTSFSPAGYFLPWLCMKIFRLPVAEKSLYLFHIGLFCLSAIIFVLLLWEVYRENRYRNLLVIIGVISYVFAPELLHGMGIVYWNQSIMQVTLLLQIYAYYRYAVNKNEKAGLFFCYSIYQSIYRMDRLCCKCGFCHSRDYC